MSSDNDDVLQNNIIPRVYFKSVKTSLALAHPIFFFTENEN